MKDVIKNVAIFGVILYVINFVLNFGIEKIFDIVNLESLYDTNMILYGVITMVIGIIIYLIAMLITKKIVSLKIEINYEKAKKMLKTLLIIFLIIASVRCIISYNSSLKIEKALNNAISQLKETKSSKEFQKMSESTRETVNTMYKIYVNGKDKILNLENQRRQLIIIQWVSDVFIYIMCLYVFGLFLYRKEKKYNELSSTESL